MSECPVCKGYLAKPTGPEDSPILIIANAPHWSDLKKGWLWSGDKDEAGDLMRQEFTRAGLNFRDCRTHNLWMHREVKVSADAYEEEWKFHTKQLDDAIEGRKALLLLGRQPVDHLLGEKISDLENTSFMKDGILYMICRHPSVALRRGGVIGNVRHAIERFSEELKGREIL